jgi:hypothetical protein
MTAILPHDQRPPSVTPQLTPPPNTGKIKQWDQSIPRVNTKNVAAGRPTDSNGRVLQYVSTQAQLRYQHLPDFDRNESDEQIRAKLEERFTMLRIMGRKCITGKCRAFTVSGPGGVGKTFDLDKILSDWDPEKEKHSTSSGYVRMTHLYRLLWQNRHPGDIVKLDDSDSLFYDTNSLNMLKRACDTTEERWLVYGSEKVLFDDNDEPIPRTFKFEGTMIFVSNLDFDWMIDKGTKLAPHLEAFVTRSNYLNVGMHTKRDYLIRLFMAVEEGLFEKMQLTEEEIDDTLNFINSNYKVLRECSLRMGLKVGQIRQMADEDDEIAWDRQALLTCCRSAPPPPLPDEPDIGDEDEDGDGIPNSIDVVDNSEED